MSMVKGIVALVLSACFAFCVVRSCATMGESVEQAPAPAHQGVCKLGMSC